MNNDSVHPAVAGAQVALPPQHGIHRAQCSRCEQNSNRITIQQSPFGATAAECAQGSTDSTDSDSAEGAIGGASSNISAFPPMPHHIPLHSPNLPVIDER